MDNNKRCICLPSGMCHSHTLLGCPHNHYFDKNNVWTCDTKPQTPSYFGIMFNPILDINFHQNNTYDKN
jgi:hypothetical protein